MTEPSVRESLKRVETTLPKLLMEKDQFNYGGFKKKVKETLAAAQGVVDKKYIAPIERGLTEMDKVVQQTAANAEESASASEELNAQAGQMQAVAEPLMRIVHGSANGADAAQTGTAPSQAAPVTLAARISGAVRFGKRKKAEEAIPLERDGSFKNF